MEGLRDSKLEEGQQWRRKLAKEPLGSMGKKTPFYRTPRICPLSCRKTLERYNRSKDRYNRLSRDNLQTSTERYNRGLHR